MRIVNKMLFCSFFTILLMVICTCCAANKESLSSILNELSVLDDDIENNIETDEKISGDYRFIVNTDNTITITKYLGSELFVKIPAEIEGKLVSSIGNTLTEGGAFHACTTITNVVIPEGVTSIQNSAFSNCPNLVSVTLPASVTHLGMELFDGCLNMESIYFEGDAPKVDGDMFGVSPSQITVYYYESAIGWSNPWHTYSSETYGDYLYKDAGDGSIILTKYQGSGGNIEIPTFFAGKKVTAIGASFITQKDYILSVTIPDGIVEIQDLAFSNCPNLMTVTVPASVTFLGQYVFACCPNLYAVYMEGDAPKADNSIFVASPQTTVFYHEGTYGWTDSWYDCVVKTYGDYQYKINDDDTVTVTKYVGLGGDVQIPSEIDGKIVTTLGNYFIEKGAFQDSNTITSVVIPEGIAEILDSGFQGCSNLESAIIPASVTLLGNCVFDNCPSLQSVYFEGDAPRIGNYVFDAAAQITIYYHEEANGWSNPWYGCQTQLY